MNRFWASKSKLWVGVLAAVLLVFAAVLGFLMFNKKPIFTVQQGPQPTAPQERTWSVKSVDTMKFSRDLSAQAITDPRFDAVIDSQVKSIAATGANTVAIATPYDDRFVPILSRWVAAARRYNLHVWFRGNFSGWEGWFGVPADLSRDEHKTKLAAFIRKNPNLFVDGDIFSPCPECENGGPGDPRNNGDVSGFRNFMIDEKQLCDSEFSKIGKKVDCGLWSMNYDIAKLVMDSDTAEQMGGVVAIDHYVDRADKLLGDIDSLAKKANAKIFLGETGVPIPDINGNMTEDEQAGWIDSALALLVKDPNVAGMNYWTSFGGSTAIFRDDGTAKPAVTKIANVYKLSILPD